MNEEQAGRLRAALEYVTEHPREWVQDLYAVSTPCGTVACLAGHVVLQAGYRVLYQAPVQWFDRDSLQYRPIPGTKKAHSVILNDDSRIARIPAVAAELIGLGLDEADPLFAASNSLRAMWDLAAEYSGGLIEVPEDLPEWADLTVVDVDVDRERPDAQFSHVAAYLDQVERRVR